MEPQQDYKKNSHGAFTILMLVLSLYVGLKFVSEFRSYGKAGGVDVNVITLSGHGEVSAVPDLATVYFTIQKEAKSVKEAQDAVAVVEAQALESLKTNSIEEKDIKASNASFSPVYEYQYGKFMPCNEFGCPPSRPGKNVITGYQASESITVKVRNTDSVGKVMQDLGTLGVSDLNGPNFTIDDETALQAQARKMAINEAKAKAKVLAQDLGVRLGRIVTFNEGGNYYPTPMMYGKAISIDSALESAPAQIPKGENTISSDVTITYEIR
ncbi:MAG: SIMPL domain-containing protein [bacterium]|nr:SIMPL domain-containing protein [bacterium]